MVLTTFVLITWFVVMVIILLPKKLSFTENTFTFLLMSIIIINSFTIKGLNLNWIETNEEISYFLAFVLFRSVIYPCSLLIIVNRIYSNQKRIATLVVVSAVMAFLFLIEILGERLNMYTYLVWNHWFTLAEISLYTTLSIVLANWIHHYNRRKNRFGNI